MAIELVMQNVMALGIPGSVHGVHVWSEPGGLELDGCFKAFVVISAGVGRKDDWSYGCRIPLGPL